MSSLQCAQQIGSAFNTHSGQRTQPLATRLDSTAQTQRHRDQFAINLGARQTSCCFHLLRKRADTGNGFCSPPKCDKCAEHHKSPVKNVIIDMTARLHFWRSNCCPEFVWLGGFALWKVPASCFLATLRFRQDSWPYDESLAEKQLVLEAPIVNTWYSLIFMIFFVLACARRHWLHSSRFWVAPTSFTTAAAFIISSGHSVSCARLICPASGHFTKSLDLLRLPPRISSLQILDHLLCQTQKCAVCHLPN